MALANKAPGVEHRNTRAKIAQQMGLPPVPLALGSLSFIGMLVSLWAIFLYAPTDTVEGDVQRIFYFHVPMAWLAMLASGILALTSIVYLWRKDERWDWAARASAELGAFFTTLALITGSLWGKPIWGTWWTWDARLTTTLILWFMFIGYLMLRSYMGRTEASGRSAAVFGIITFIDVPIIYESVNWWRTLHPQAVLPINSAPQLPPEMLLTLMISLTTFTLLFSFLMIQLYQLEKLQTLAQRLRASVS